MNEKKSIQELTIKNNFMFGAVMLNPENCKETLERCLGIEIERVEVDKEKSIVYNPEFKGVRLDIYAKDENNTHYNVEMQVLRKPAIEKRARYYHGQIDMEILLSGLSYKELPDTYVGELYVKKNQNFLWKTEHIRFFLVQRVRILTKYHQS